VKRTPAGFLLLEFMVALAIFVVMVGILGGFFTHLLKMASLRMETTVACRVASDLLEKMRAGIQKQTGEIALVTSEGRRLSVTIQAGSMAQPGVEEHENNWGGTEVTVGWQSITRKPTTFKLAG
jgi:hypothetical protein